MDSKKIFKEKINIFLASVKKNTSNATSTVSRHVLDFFALVMRSLKKDSSTSSNRDLDKKLVYSLSKSRIPSLRQFKFLNKFLSPKEIVIIRTSFLVIFVSVLFLGTRFYINHLQIVPVDGGEYREALIGSVKHINPLYASASDVDRDISSLVYSSLFDWDKNGELQNDLAESYEISPDGLNYQIKLREDVYWHGGERLTADDIVFTVTSIKNKKYESPLRLSLLGVEIEKINEFSIKFNLTVAYPAFFELLTFGILPKVEWSQASPEYFSLDEKNIKPIGSGPYKAKGLVRKEKSGIITQYNLVVNKNYYRSIPKTDISFYIYPNFEPAIEAMNRGEVDGISYLPRDLKQNIITPKAFDFHKIYLPQQTNLFFNSKNNAALGDKAVRQAMAYAINKNEIINNVLGGTAYAVDGPILSYSSTYNPNIKKYDYNIATAEKLLDGVDWKISVVTADNISKAVIDKESGDEDLKRKAEKLLEVGEGSWRLKQENYFVLYLTVNDSAEGKLVSEYLKNFWEAVGIKTILNVVDQDKIETGVIAHKNFEVILYGQILGNNPDLYSFWHSSQSANGGLNFSNFANNDADKLLVEARLIADKKQRKEKYFKFQEIVSEELPVIFIYSPTYTYTQSKKVKGFDVQNIQNPSDRFSNVLEWYTQTGKKIIW